VFLTSCYAVFVQYFTFVVLGSHIQLLCMCVVMFSVLCCMLFLYSGKHPRAGETLSLTNKINNNDNNTTV